MAQDKALVRLGSHHLMLKHAISFSPHNKILNQTGNETVEMFKLSSLKVGHPASVVMSRIPRTDNSVHVLDARFLRILKIFKWRPNAEKALEVLMLKLDHRLVREVMKTKVKIGVKIQFFRWVSKKSIAHDSTTYMALIRYLNEPRYMMLERRNGGRGLSSRDYAEDLYCYVGVIASSP